MKSFYTASFLFFLLIFTGCAYQENLNTFNRLYYEKKPQEAFVFSKKKIKNHLLWQIQSGVSGYIAGNYKESMSILDTAEKLLNHKQAQGILSNSLSNTGATLINDNVKSYQGSIYEGVLINYYKALDALAIGDNSRARVEFNRANDRQRRAKEYYEKEIQKAIKIQKEKYKKDPKASEEINQNTSSEKIDKILNSQYSNLKHFAIYSGFINPLVSYISGLYFSLQGDPKGMDLLKEAYGINHSKIIAQDMFAFQNNKYDKKKYTWIVIEDGKSPTKKEFSIKLPLYLISSEVLYFGLALPQLEEGISFYNSFDIKTKMGSKNFEEISLFDGIIANEFSKQLPYIITRAIISAVYKASMQSVLTQTLGSYAAIGGALFSAATTAADTRITTVFPHKVWLNRIENNKEQINLLADGREILEIGFEDCTKNKNPPLVEKSTPVNEKEYKICKNSNNIIYIRTTKNNIIPKLIIGEKQ
ncbi:hypothetical protein [Helicobacter cappadocius]|uniref:Lipoprotein n=1 Tax=Helicobacter cappadocius TaxID=3063998 RepID=A0AA90TEC4_9HELI|nr:MULTISPECIES: hypothetical protein [unclassified Helicobacter]MDO7252578.1 hypothetical protein [Helicobacter sp. faydin-H75]MDP2538445.1 hypothetical protein [Helicobacter sp. faydin-H76]